MKTDQDIEIKKEDLEEVALQIQSSSMVLTEITQAIQTMASEFYQLKVAGIEDKEGLETVHKARMIVKNTRVAVDHRRKELNEDAIKHQRNVNAAAKLLTEQLTPIETYLEDQEDVVEKEQARIRAEQIRIEEERIRKEQEEKAEAQRIENERLLAQRKRELEIEAEERERERQRIQLQNEEDLRIQRQEQDRKAAELTEKQARLDQADKDRLIWEERIAKEQAELKEERRKLEEQKAASVEAPELDITKEFIELSNQATPIEAQIGQLEREAQQEDDIAALAMPLQVDEPSDEDLRFAAGIKKMAPSAEEVADAVEFLTQINPQAGAQLSKEAAELMRHELKDDKEKLLHRFKLLTEYSQDQPELTTQKAADIWNHAAREIESVIAKALIDTHKLPTTAPTA